jgi:hypothetical protein
MMNRDARYNRVQRTESPSYQAVQLILRELGKASTQLWVTVKGKPDGDVLRAAIGFLDNSVLERTKQSLAQDLRKEAEVTLSIAYPHLRDYMCPSMWNDFFRFISESTNAAESPAIATVPVSEPGSNGNPARIREILRKHAPLRFSELTPELLREVVFPELVEKGITVPLNQKTRKSWAKSFTELKEGTKAYRNVMKLFRRYYYYPSMKSKGGSPQVVS